jgi:hypothetical protein
MPQFKVVLDGIKLSDRDTARINSAIQRTVLSELANVDQRGDKASLVLEKLGPEIFGLIALPLELAQLSQQPGLEHIGKLNEQFDQSF